MRSRLSGIVFIVGLVCGSSASDASPRLDLRRLVNDTGPSHNSIFSITQDHRGFLWLGTQDGLNRFDGQGFRVYRHDPRDPETLSANRVSALLEDSSRRLWVGTAAGIDRLHRATQRFQRYAVPGAPAPGAPVLDLFEGPAGTLWAGTGVGLLRYDADNDAWTQGLPNGPRSPVHRVRESRSGVVWMLVAGSDPEENELWRVETGGRTERRPVGRRFGLALDAEQRPWVDGDGPFDWQDTAGVSGGPPVRDVLIEEDGRVWVGTSQGLELPLADGTRIRQPVTGGGDLTLADYVADVYRDRSGILWLGTEHGLYRHDPHRKAFRHHSVEPTLDRGVGGPPIASLAETPAGDLWAGAYQASGLYRLKESGSGFAFIHSGFELRAAQVPALLVHRDRLLVGSSRLCELSFCGERLECEPPGNPGVRALAVDDSGRLWRTAEGAILGADPAGGWRRYPYEVDETRPGEAEVIHLLADGESLWVATWGGPLRRFDLERETFESIRRIDETGLEQVGPVLDLLRGADGTLWLATSDGLSSYDTKNGVFRHYTHGHGLPGTNVYSLLEDPEGRLWMGTNNGLASFDAGAGESGTFRSYGRDDGVVNVEFNRHAKLATSDGRFLFGGLSGLTEFRPQTIRDNPVAPPVAILGIEVLGKNGPRRLEPYGLSSMTLGPGDSAVSIEFVALGFTNPAGQRYAFRLEGLERAWIDSGDVRVARYTGIPPGDYVFRVKAANSDGVWNEEGVSLALRVLPPYWKTWWFRSSILALVAAVLALAYRIRVRHLIELERVRLRIAGDLHDELGSELSGIAMATARLASKEYLEPPDRRRLDDVRASAVQVMQGLRDIVWYVNPEQDSLTSLAARMRSAAPLLLGGLEPRFVIEVPDDALELDMAIRRGLYLIYKELLTNAARHSGARRVTIRLTAGADGLVLEVEDDGVGFDPSASTDGSGLGSIRRRAVDLGADFEIDSGPDIGCRARLYCKMTRTRQGAAAAESRRIAG